MIKIRSLVLVLVLMIPATTFAQAPAANRNWNAFWAKFTSAVNRKSRASVKSLMASEKDFFSGGGGESRDEWLTMVEEQKWWGLLQKSVRRGVKNYNYDGKPGRVTKNDHLIFAYIGGRWRFTGPMGD